MSTPLITVLMPAYNAAKYIAEAIRSVLEQSFRDFELLIINDGSTDNTENIIRSFTDSRIRLVSQANAGVAAALNKGILLAKAEYIARFDADDICLPQRLQKQYDFLETHPGYVLTGADATYIDQEGNHVFDLAYPAYTDEQIRGLPPSVCPFSHVTVMYRRSAVIAAGGYNINAHTFEDHLLWHQILLQGKVNNIPEVLVAVRFSPGSVTIDDSWRSRAFKRIKAAAIYSRQMDDRQGALIYDIIRRQDKDRVKKGAYYSLLAKKYLFNNYNLAMARANIRKLLQIYPAKRQGYILLGLSVFPPGILKMIYKTNKNNAGIHQ